MLLTESLLGTSSVAANYIEDVFSTYLYTGTGASQTITNGIDLSGKGGLVWIKSRSGSSGHFLTDSNIVAQQKYISSNSTNAAADWGSRFSVFLNNGFRLGADDSTTFTANVSGTTYASWSFRKQAKFFDVVTYTGTGANRTIAHNLGSVPGCIITKRTDTTGNWITYHRSLGNTDFVNLNTTAGTSADSGAWNNTSPTSTEFSLGTGNTNVNGGTYVAYLFAHDAGGFGASGSDNVISCGSYTGNGSATGPSVTLGYEPQWVLIKQSSSSGNDWQLYDSMRGLATGDGGDNGLFPNSTSTEDTNATIIKATATGFQLETLAAALNANGSTYIYIAIRRGPMKTPTSGTSVFSPITTNTTAGTKQTTNFPIDAQIFRGRRTATSGSAAGTFVIDRLRGVSTNSTEVSKNLATNTTGTEPVYDVGCSLFWDNTGFQVTSFTDSESAVWWSLRRAPGFFDVVCYTGTGANRTVSHNLGVAPELMIVKNRTSGTQRWRVYVSSLGANNYIELNTNNASQSGIGMWNNTAPTSSVFTVGTDDSTNQSGSSLVAYLFATVAGVSKVGSYTGTGTTKQIDCGFTGGARFVLIKRTDSTGDWYVWDSARGIVSGDDPYLLLNSTAAEVTNTDYIDTYSAGFEISSTAPAAINANGGTFIFLAIA